MFILERRLLALAVKKEIGYILNALLLLALSIALSLVALAQTTRIEIIISNVAFLVSWKIIKMLAFANKL